MFDYEEGFSCKDGRAVRISIDDSSLTIRIFDEHGSDVGKLMFNEVDGVALKLIWAFLDKQTQYTQQGIGRRCLQIMKERYGLPIIAEDNDGIERSDGSHLTGDAPGFVAQMRREGVIEPSEFSRYDHEDFQD